MISEGAIATYVLAGASTTLAVVFSLPALTGVDNGLSAGLQSDHYDAAVDAELAYCQLAGLPVNCLCFAKTSGLIIAYQPERPLTYLHMDQRLLARSQARSRC